MAPECSIAVLVTPEIFMPVAALGCAQELVADPKHLGLLRIIRATTFRAVCIVNDGAGAPGQMRNDILALAARTEEILWCTPDGAMTSVTRARLATRLCGEGVLSLFAFGAGAAVGVIVAVTLAAAGVLGFTRRRRR
jgi:MprA protease rhombosortase-interaction domain-containing protein